MKYLLVIIALFSSPVSALAQTDCGERLEQLIKQADEHFRDGYFRQAYEEYRAARACQKANLTYIDQQMVAAMDGIDKQRVKAQEKEKEAIAAKAVAENAKKDAIQANKDLQIALHQAKLAEIDAINAKNEAITAKEMADSLLVINRRQLEDLRNTYDQKTTDLTRKANQYLKKLEYDSAFLTCRTIYSIPEGDKKGAPLLFELLYFYNESGQPDKCSEALILASQAKLPVNRSAVSAYLKEWNAGLFDSLTLLYYPEMIPVKGGTYLMGADPGRDKILLDDAPLHYETLEDFSIGKTEVTKRQYLVFAVMNGDAASLTGKYGEEPMDEVSWIDAVAYLNWLNLQMGNRAMYQLEQKQLLLRNGKRSIITQVTIASVDAGYRLPLETEWEYAARGGPYQEQSLYPGSDIWNSVSWQAGNTTVLQPVGSLAPNSLGLFDMSGNVAEWCWDIYYPKNKSANNEYQANLSKYHSPTLLRINRGSSYKDRKRFGELARRDYLNIESKREVGFRVVLGIPYFSTPNK